MPHDNRMMTSSSLKTHNVREDVVQEVATLTVKYPFLFLISFHRFGLQS